MTHETSTFDTGNVQLQDARICKSVTRAASARHTRIEFQFHLQNQILEPRTLI